jgi:hypothetical protein
MKMIVWPVPITLEWIGSPSTDAAWAGVAAPMASPQVDSANAIAIRNIASLPK